VERFQLKRISILGSTGSIDVSTLEIVSRFPEKSKGTKKPPPDKSRGGQEERVE